MLPRFNHFPYFSNINSIRQNNFHDIMNQVMINFLNNNMMNPISLNNNMMEINNENRPQMFRFNRVNPPNNFDFAFEILFEEPKDIKRKEDLDVKCDIDRILQSTKELENKNNDLETIINFIPFTIIKDKPNKIKESNLRCVICLMDFENGQKISSLPCCHAFHTECLDKWINRNRKCPICKFEVTLRNLLGEDFILEKFRKRLEEIRRKERERIEKEKIEEEEKKRKEEKEKERKEKIEKERKEKEEKKRIEKERKEKEEKERIEKEEKERIEKEEKERKEKEEKERIEKEEKEKKEKEEKGRKEKEEKIEKERKERERKEKERKEKEKKEKERKEIERKEKERKEKEERERIKKERNEKEGKRNKEKERIEKERKLKEYREKKEKEKIENMKKRHKIIHNP